MQGHVKTNGFSGSILLAREGKPLVSKGYGFANIEWQIPNTPQTKFRIGSITKQFTSMAVMQLREQGKLKLEDSVCALRRAVSRGVEGGDDPSPADAYVRHPELHRAGRMAKGHDGAKDGRRDDRLLPRPAAAVDAGREVRLQQLRLLPARRGHRKGDRQEIRGRGAGADLHAARRWPTAATTGPPRSFHAARPATPAGRRTSGTRRRSTCSSRTPPARCTPRPRTC